MDARVALYSEEAEEELLQGRPDFVLDAIDNIDTKVALLAACRHRGIPILCCAGAGACSTELLLWAGPQGSGCRPVQTFGVLSSAGYTNRRLQ